MGQKVNPNLFRLNINFKHLSNWYANKNLYNQFLKEDYYLRLEINNFFKNILLISNIEINRIYNKSFNNYIFINLEILYPKIENSYYLIKNYLIKYTILD